MAKFAQPFKDYEILGRLGSGGMGTVFKARRKSDDAFVALKVLRPSLSRNSRYVERLKREADISMLFDHEHLVKGYGIGEEGGYHYLVMQYIDGKSLKSLLRTWGRFPEEQVLDLGMQMASALDHAHSQGVIHRDVKPGNILVDDEGHAMLTDLGLAKGEADPTLTRDGATVGTPQYMSPEQAHDPRNVDERSDLYSLGATLYHMCVGHPPFDGESIGQVITKLLTQRADSVDAINPDLSKGLNLMLRRLLVKTPDERYQSAKELLDDLKLVEAGGVPTVDERALIRAEGVGQRRWYRQPLTAAVLGGGLVALVLAIFFWPNQVMDANETWENVQTQVARSVDKNDYLNAILALEKHKPEAEDVHARQELLRQTHEQFARVLRTHLDSHGLRYFKTWLEVQEIENAENKFFSQVIPGLVRERFRYSFDSLPQRAVDAYQAWEAYEKPHCRKHVRARSQALVDTLMGKFREFVKKTTVPHLQKRRYGDVYGQLQVLFENPWRCQFPGNAKHPHLPEEDRELMIPLSNEIRTERDMAKVAAGARVKNWESELRGVLRLASDAINQQQFVSASTKIDAVDQELQRVAEGQRSKSWINLPRTVQVPLDDLEQQARTVRAELVSMKALARKNKVEMEWSDLRTLQDQVHAALANELNFAEAKRILVKPAFQDDKVQEALADLGREVSRLQGFFGSVADLLKNEATKEKQLWFIHGEQQWRMFVKVDRGPPMTVHFKAEGKVPGAVDKVPFHDFDPAPMVRHLKKIRRRSSKAQLSREMIFLYLFYGDAFDGISRYRPINQGYEVRIKRRKAILQSQGPRKRDQIKESLDQVEKAITKDELGLALRILAQLQTVANPELLDPHRTWIALLEARIQDRSTTLALNKRLPSALRDDVLLLPLDNQSISKAQKLRCELDFADPAKFLKGIGSWAHGEDGLLPPTGLEEFPDKQWQNEVEMAVDIYENKEAMSAAFRIHLPAVGPVVDVFGLQFLGARFVFVQLDNFSVQLRRVKSLKDFKHYMDTLREIVKDKNKVESAWYFVPGANYDFVLDVKPTSPGKRSFIVRVNGQTVFSDELRTQRGSKTSLALRSIGRVVLKKLSITGKPAR